MRLQGRLKTVTLFSLSEIVSFHQLFFPRFMGEGFVVAATNDHDVYYYMDEAGVIPEDKVIFYYLCQY
jgi:hypothetical protein